MIEVGIGEEICNTHPLLEDVKLLHCFSLIFLFLLIYMGFPSLYGFLKYMYLID